MAGFRVSIIRHRGNCRTKIHLYHCVCSLDVKLGLSVIMERCFQRLISVNALEFLLFLLQIEI